MNQVTINEASKDLAQCLHAAEQDYVVIVKDGKPVGAMIGFADEDDWFDFQLESDPRFHRRIVQARQSIKQGKGIKLEEIKFDE